MKVKELIEYLEGMNPEAEVRLAMQPSWPFEYSIQNDVVESEDGERVYLAESRQLDYLNGEVQEALGWR